MFLKFRKAVRISSRHHEYFSIITRIAKVSASILFFTVLSTTAVHAQCAGNAAVTPITSTDESALIPGGRLLQSGSGTTVNLSTPNRVQIDVTSTVSPPGVSNIPQKRTGTWSNVLTSSAAYTKTNITAPTTSGTAAANPGTSGALIRWTTAATSGSVGGVHSAGYAETEYAMSPIFSCRIQTGSSITNQRLWLGMAAAALSGSATPAVNCAAFRYTLERVIPPGKSTRTTARRTQ